MCHRRFLIVMIALASYMQVTICVEDDALITFIFERIPLLQGQARGTGRRQFAALILNTQREVAGQVEFQFRPGDHTPIVDNTQPFSPPTPLNYIVARPERPQHAEEIIIGQLENMWNNFVNFNNGPPARIIVFTRLYPCTVGTPGGTRECAERIRNTLQEPPYNVVPFRVLAYDEEEDSPVPDQQGQNIQFMMAGIMIQGLAMGNCFNNHRAKRMAYATFPACIVPSKIQSMQGCVRRCLGDDIYSFTSDADVEEQAAYLMNILIDNCLLHKQRGLCYKNVVLERTGPYWSSVQKQYLANKLVSCHQNCRFKPISKPCVNAQDFNDKIALLTSVDDRRRYPHPYTICKDKRRTGFLCTYIGHNYLTAGNSLCRQGHPCGYYGKDYLWCHTTYDKNWDYCCLGECGYHNNDYLWCDAGGGQWQYCGKGGMIATGTNTGGTPYPCLADHPCGHHRDLNDKTKYFWCYIDTVKSWDYCCSPRDTCSSHGTSYRWCRTSYMKEGGNWQYCYY